jgi:hypothetical protein
MLGIDINQEVVDHARTCTHTWMMSLIDKGSASAEPLRQDIQFYQGNCLGLDPSKMNKYDRIYVGAACTSQQSRIFASLLTLGGVLVAPIDDDLIKISRTSDNDFLYSHITSVRFTSLVNIPQVNPKSFSLPMEGWSPCRSGYFPRSFRSVMMTLLLFHRFGDTTVHLSLDIWMHVLSYMHRLEVLTTYFKILIAQLFVNNRDWSCPYGSLDMTHSDRDLYEVHITFDIIKVNVLHIRYNGL